MITVLGEKKSTEDLKKIEIQRPERAGNRWKGISHYELATHVETSLKNKGIKILSETWSTDRTGQSLVGGLNLTFPLWMDIPNIKGMDYSLGIRHSNNCKHALTFAVGTQIMVCTNGLISGEFVLSRKHTNGLDLENEIEKGVDRFIEEAGKVENCIEQLKSRELSRLNADNYLMEAGRKRLLPWSHIGMVEKEYENPSFPDFNERTGWGAL